MSTPFLDNLFSKAYVVGGSPCSGKSTIAEILSAQFGFRYYKADDHESEHMERARPEQQPIMFKYSKMSWNDIWSQAPEKLYLDEITYYYERFPLILDDLKRFDIEHPVILEGAAFLPELSNHFPVKQENIVFMIPTVEFQVQPYSQRPWIQTILNECQDPKQAFANWMQRDEMFGQEVMRQANVNGYQVITVDGPTDIHQQFEMIRSQFKLSEL